MWRRQADLDDGVISPTPPVRVPKVEIPDLPPPGYAWIEVERDELAMRKLLKANGAEWFGKDKLWRIRSDLVEPLGLQNRIARGSRVLDR